MCIRDSLYSGPMTLPARLVSAVLGGICLTLAFPGYGIWPLAPVGVAFAAIATMGARARVGWTVGMGAGLVFFVPTLSWAGTDFLGVIPWLGLSVLQSLYFGFQGWLSGLLSRRVGWIAAVSYTHLDVYKRQTVIPCAPKSSTLLLVALVSPQNT